MHPGLTPKSFLHLLVAASIVPYLIVMACAFTLTPAGTAWDPFIKLVIAVAFLNGIHAPSTLYLYFDRDIQKQAKSAPFVLIYMPLLFIIGSFVAVLALTINDAVWAKYLLVAYLLAFVHWVDSFIWRLSEPGPRDWMLSRYRQVLPASA